VKAIVCVGGRGWQAVVRAAALYLPREEGTEAVLLHVVDERAAHGYDLALRGLLGRTRGPKRGADPEAASREAGEALLAEARELLAVLRPDLAVSVEIRTGPPNEELVVAAEDSSADVVFVGRGEPGDGRRATATGAVKGWRHGPRGEANGLLLDDGTEIRFPPHLADEVRSVVGEGVRITVEGEWRGPERRHLHARRMTAEGSGARVELAHGPRGGGPGKKPLGHTARYVVDHAGCDVVLVSVRSAGPEGA